MVKVRFAPSPTGFLHLGSARTALFNWLYARHTGGKFLLRIEDTDKVRSSKKFLDEILGDLKWLGIDWDEEPLCQSQRFDVYRQKAEEILAMGNAYKESEAVIFKVEKGRQVEVDDMIHGKIAVNTDDIKDQVMIKSDGSPTYNFACVVDDTYMEITHILRGDDHISNTPKQILFYEAMGLTPPKFGHMPLILGQDGAKLSKRHGGVSVEEYKKEGFLPGALANYLILLGWFPGEDREVLSLDEAVKLFDINDMSDVQAKFDIQKLRWLNGEYIMKHKTEELLPLIKDQLLTAGFDISGITDEYISKLVDLYKIRIKTLSELGDLADWFFRDDFTVDEEGKKKYLEKEGNRENVKIFADRLEGLEDFSRENIEKICREIAEERELKAADIIHPTRMAISGKTRGAGLFETMELLGKERVIKRMRGIHK
ncbi:MAG: glutamate--tRNA ligase [Candidatus Aminicenantes bacterium]|nr:glutamate--tRNA ligase [Candidatus Aminicenantes bacterium]